MATDGFLGRWSRRKLSEDKAPGKATEAQVDADASASASGAQTDPFALRYRRLPEASIPAEDASIAELSKPQPEPSVSSNAPEPPLPTMQDAQALTPESDFKPFMAKGLEPQVRNAAMKKLFADPRYNVMDRLDTYIDDYSLPRPDSRIHAAQDGQRAVSWFV